MLPCLPTSRISRVLLLQNTATPAEHPSLALRACASTACSGHACSGDAFARPQVGEGIVAGVSNRLFAGVVEEIEAHFVRHVGEAELLSWVGHSKTAAGARGAKRAPI